MAHIFQKLTKNKGTFLAVVFIILVVYNAITFMIPFKRGIGFWAGYGFSMLALLLSAAISFYAFSHEGLKSKYYGIPLISVLWRYLIIQLIIGLFQMIFDFIPFRFGLAVNVIILGGCLIGLITTKAGKKGILNMELKR